MGEHQGSYNRAFQAALQAMETAAASRAAPEGLRLTCDELDGLPQSQVRLLSRNSRRVSRPDVVLELIRRSDAHRFSDPRRMLRLATLAHTVACEIQRSLLPPGLVADLRAAALTAQGNAYKVLGDLRSAESSLLAAHQAAAQGTGDPLVAARIRWIVAVVRERQGRFADALIALEEAIAEYRTVGDSVAAGQCMLSLCVVRRQLGDFPAAIRCAIEGAQSAAIIDEPELRIAAVQNVASCLVAIGEAGFPAALLEEIQDLYEALPGHLPLLRLRWLQGRIQASLRKPVEARVAFNAVRRTFLEMGLFLDAALVSLELAALYAEAGWPHEVERLAEEMYPVFLSRDLPREASAALLLFVEVVNERTATPARIRQILVDLQAKHPAQG